MVERIKQGNKVIAVIIKATYSNKGIEFFSPNYYSQQLGYMSRPEGYVIAPHVHNEVPRCVAYTKETIFIKKGKVRVDFYDDDKVYLESKILQTGDVILLAFGGHGFKMLEATEMIEVKQGPYVENKDKVHFEAICDTNIIIKD